MASSHQKKSSTIAPRSMGRGVLPLQTDHMKKVRRPSRPANDNPASVRFFVRKLTRWFVPLGAGALLIYAALS